MAYPVSTRWEKHLRRGATPVTEVDVFFPGQGIIFRNLPVTDGTITFARENSYRASGSLTVGDPALFPTVDNPTALEPYGAEIVIRTGIVYPEGIGDLRAGISASDLAAQGAAELVPLGTFPIQGVSGSEATGRIAKVDFYDRGRRLEDFSFVAPKDVGGQLIQSVIEGEILDSDPFFPPLDTDAAPPGGLVLPGGNGNFSSTPDHTSLDIVSDIDMRIDVTPVDHTPSAQQYLASKWLATGNQRSWGWRLNTDGTLSFIFSPDGTSTTTLTSSVAAFSSVVRKGLRFTLDFDEGGGGSTGKFWTAATIEGPWVQLGGDVGTSGGATISLSDTDVDFISGSQTTYTHNSVSFGTANSGRIIAVVAQSESSGPTRQALSCTIGGISATRIAFVNHEVVTTIFAAQVPTGTSGNVAITYSGQMNRNQIGVFRLTGANFTVSDIDTETASSGTGGTLTVDIPANAVAIAGWTTGIDNSHSWSGATEEWDNSLSGLSRASGASVAATGTDRNGHNITVSHSNSSQAISGCAAVFTAASTANSIFAGTADLEIGAISNGTETFEGTVHSFELYNGIEDIQLIDIDYFDHANDTVSFVNNGLTHTVHGTAKIVNESAASLGWTVTFDSTLDNFSLPTGTLIEEERWQFLEEMARSLGAEIFFYRDGNVYVNPVPGIYGEDSDPVPDWVIDAGEDGILKDADRTVSRDDVYNGVVVVGTAPDDSSPQPFALITDDDPNSLTRYGGPFGKSLKRIEDSNLTTTAQCETAARSELRNITGLQRNLSFESIGNPAMDPGDILLIVFPDGTSEIHMLDGYTYDFATMNLSAETRSIQFIPPES